MEEYISSLQGKNLIDTIARQSISNLNEDENTAGSISHSIKLKLSQYVSDIKHGGTGSNTESGALGNIAHGMTSSMVMNDNNYFLGSAIDNDIEVGKKYSAINLWNYIKNKIKFDQSSSLQQSDSLESKDNLLVIQNGTLTKSNIQSVINSATIQEYFPTDNRPVSGKALKEAIESVIGTDTYATCESEHGEINKAVSVSYFKLQKGVTIYVKFEHMNTAYKPTISVNNTGAKYIKVGNDNVQPGWIQANKVYTLVYDGVSYQITNLSNNTNVFTYRPLSEVVGYANNDKISEVLCTVKQNFTNPKAMAYLAFGLGDYYYSARFSKYLLAGFNHYAGTKRNSPDTVKDEVHFSDTKGNGLGYVFISSAGIDNGESYPMDVSSNELYQYSKSEIYLNKLGFILSAVEEEIGHPIQSVGRRIPYNSSTKKSFEFIGIDEIEEKLFIPTEVELYGHSVYGCEDLGINQNKIFPLFTVAPQMRCLTDGLNKPYWLATPAYTGSDGDSSWCVYNTEMCDSNICNANDTGITIRIGFYL